MQAYKYSTFFEALITEKKTEKKRNKKSEKSENSKISINSRSKLNEENVDSN